MKKAGGDGMRKAAVNQMNRTILVWLLTTFFWAITSGSQAQQGRVFRVGVMVVGSPDIPQIKGLRDGLKELGYIPGKNLALDVSAEETYDQYRPLVKSYERKKAGCDRHDWRHGNQRCGKKLRPEIPVVFYFGSDPVQAGFVRSIARPRRESYRSDTSHRR